jgi:hypothetical protein
MGKQNGKEIERTQRRYRILQAKVAGASVRQIAEQENLSVGMIQKDVQRALADLAKEHIGEADQIRAIQMERYNQILLRWYNRALAGEPEATKIILAIMDKINQINGLYQTVNVYDQRKSLTVNNNNPITFRIIDNDNSSGISETTVISETEASNILPA